MKLNIKRIVLLSGIGIAIVAFMFAMLVAFQPPYDSSVTELGAPLETNTVDQVSELAQAEQDKQ